MDLPDDVEALLAEGLGAYVRASEPERLPKNLRRLKGFRPKTLLAHRDELLSLLDDEVQRKLVLRWLDDRTPGGPPKRVREVLRLATDRAEGWQEGLAGRSRGPDPALSAPARDYEAELEAERFKSKRLRDDKRRAQTELRAEAEAERRRADALARDNGALGKRIAELERRLGEAEANRGRVVEEAERRGRRLEREADRARTQRDDISRELKEARKRISALEKQAPVSKPRPHGVPKRASPEREPPPARRVALGVPQGLFEEDPKTLDAWLKAPNVSLLVDGYNVSKSEGGFGDLNLESQRTRLIDEIDRLARSRRVPATIVFDGASISPGAARRSRKQVRVEYSRPPEIADDHLMALLGDMDAYPVILVTNDRELQGRAAELGATLARSQQLLALIR